MPNPFAYGARITDSSRFVGRANELRRIFAMLDTAHTGQLQSVSVVGSRRIGKSSLLYHLTQTYKQKLSQPDRYTFAYIDLQENSATASLPALNAHIVNTLRPAQPPIASLSLVEFESALKQFESAKLVPVICVDEFEKLIERPEIFPNDLYDSWRSLMNNSHASFVVASHLPLHEIVKSTKLTSSFFNIFSDFITLGELADSEARELINWGKTCDKPFTQSECDWAIHKAVTILTRFNWQAVSSIMPSQTWCGAKWKNNLKRRWRECCPTPKDGRRDLKK
jgi:hypothetical protein